MTTINNIADLARILREQPEWAEALRSLILTQELLELPERFAELSERIRVLAQSVADLTEATNRNFELVNRRLDNLESAVDLLQSDVGTLKSDVGTLKSDVGTLKSDVGTLKSDVGTLKSDVGTLKSDVATLKSDVATLKTDMVEVKEKLGNLDTIIGQIQATIHQMQGRMDNGFGMNYELKVERNIRSIAGQQLNIRGARVLSGVRAGLTDQLIDIIDEAVSQGLITESQSDEVLLLDLVFRGQDREDSTSVLVAAEVSIGVGGYDVRRVAERATLLQQATRARVTPLVIGTRIDEERTILAESMGVAVALFPDD